MSQLEAASTEEGADPGEEAVRVFVRIRPLNKRELEEKQTIGWDFNDKSMIEDTQNGQRVYAYDHVFGPNSTNQETYDIVGKPVVLKAMEGFNGTVFTYGQTGSGKTWTMRGCASDPGMMILCVRDILEWVKQHPQHKYMISISYLEVYNEEINDLLGEEGPASKNLKIVSEGAVKGAVIGGLTEEPAETAEDFMTILQKGEASRSYATTKMNAESSRSHTIYRVSIQAQDRESPNAAGRISYLNLVDLAGSERQKSTKAEGKVLKEGANINKSLLALGAVINKLGEASSKSGKGKGGKGQFIPYRDSKLTRILKQSLGGNTLTSMLCAVTPAPMHREETVSTLKFGQLCKSIKNSVKSNDGMLDDKTIMKQLRQTIEDLRDKLEKGGGDMTALTAVKRENIELEGKVKALEQLLIDGGQYSAEDILSRPETIIDAQTERDLLELSELRATTIEQQRKISSLQTKIEEYQDLEDTKAEFYEHEQKFEARMVEESMKLQEEKEMIQADRFKTLKDRSSLDEKETRVRQLEANLDEKESKLKQLLATMNEQQEQWKRSVTDLQRREDLVDDWQRNHRLREKKLQETTELQKSKYQELKGREETISEQEQQQKNLQRELQEREQRLQVALSKISTSEQELSSLEKKLKAFESDLKRKENDCDVRDRELLSRRKEMDSWNALLGEKDRKISAEQKNLDERESSVRASEERTRTKEIDVERRLVELRQNEASAQQKVEKYEKLLVEVEERDRDAVQQLKECDSIREELLNRENELNVWEKQLQKLAERVARLEEREDDLQVRIREHKKVEHDFFNVKVAQITSRHGKELAQLENLVSQQLKIASDFQNELQNARSDLSKKTEELEEAKALVEQRNILVEELREQLTLVEMDPNSSAATEKAKKLQTTNSIDGFSPEPKESDPEGEAPVRRSHLNRASTSMNGNTTNGSGNNDSSAWIHTGFEQNGGEGSNSGIKRNTRDFSHSQSPRSGRNEVEIGDSQNNLIVQLASAQKALFRILDQNNALPPDNSNNHAPRGISRTARALAQPEKAQNTPAAYDPYEDYPPDSSQSGYDQVQHQHQQGAQHYEYPGGGQNIPFSRRQSGTHMGQQTQFSEGGIEVEGNNGARRSSGANNNTRIRNGSRMVNNMERRTSNLNNSSSGYDGTHTSGHEGKGGTSITGTPEEKDELDHRMIHKMKRVGSVSRIGYTKSPMNFNTGVGSPVSPLEEYHGFSSPDLSSLVRSGGKRNGIPVTMVDLGKMGAAMRRSPKVGTPGPGGFVSGPNSPLTPMGIERTYSRNSMSQLQSAKSPPFKF